MSDLKQKIKAVVLDWDETITETDTMAIISRVTTEPTRWPEFVDAYMSDLQKHQDTYGEVNSLSEFFEFLGSLSSVEICSVRRIESAGVFKGVTHDDLRETAKTVAIRDGFPAFYERLGSNVSKEVLSVNWSQEFILYGLPVNCKPEEWKITANSLVFDDDARCTGAVSKDKDGGIRTALDKLRYLQTRISETRKMEGLLVYVGDSNTDLPCLLEADLGIVFGRNQSLMDNCEKYGITTLPFRDLNMAKPYVRQDRRLYRILSWDELKF